jgi:hypothetical protein
MLWDRRNESIISCLFGRAIFDAKTSIVIDIGNLLIGCCVGRWREDKTSVDSSN